MILIFLFAGFSIFAANENNIINASPKYFGQYVSYKNPQRFRIQSETEIKLKRYNILLSFLPINFPLYYIAALIYDQQL